jgi:hypothetical protein
MILDINLDSTVFIDSPQVAQVMKQLFEGYWELEEIKKKN